MVDLHLHTTMSDGQYSPADTIRLAAERGVSILSITDHDTISGINEGTLAAREYGVSFIPGIEISVNGNKELHILGYCIDINNRNLCKMCENFETLRNERKLRIFEYLRGKGVVLSEAQVEKHVSHGRVGRPHFAKAMVEAGYVSDIPEAFVKYLSTEEFYKIERPKPNPPDSIDVISEAGGTAVLAHPALLNLSNSETEDLLNGLVSAGLAGLECHYSTHTREQTNFYLSLARKYNLIVTGGSDFHGENIKPDIKIGTGINNSLNFDDELIAGKLMKRKLL